MTFDLRSDLWTLRDTRSSTSTIGGIERDKMCTYYQCKIHNISRRKVVKMADFGTSSANSNHALEKATRPASTFYYHKLYMCSRIREGGDTTILFRGRSPK